VLAASSGYADLGDLALGYEGFGRSLCDGVLRNEVVTLLHALVARQK